MLMRNLVYFSVSLLLALQLTRCAVNPVTGKKELMLLSKNQEIAMGRESDPEIVAAYGIYPDKDLQQFMDVKGQEIVKISHRPNIKYEFKILDSPIVNAFAVPGGYVYFTRGILAQLNSEAELAGVLGHEIGHIAARHSAKQYSRMVAAQLGLAIGSAVFDEFAQFSDLASAGARLLFLKYGRDAERESDRLGVEYSTKIGYDADAMADFFTTLSRMGGHASQELPVFLSTHPDPGEREKNVRALADKWKKKGKGENYTIERNAYLRRIDGIVYGEDPRQGYVEDQVFFHPELRFSFPIPQGWNVQNTPQQVSLFSPKNDAIIVLGISEGRTLREAANALLTKHELKLLSENKQMINGLQAVHFIASGGPSDQSLELSIFLIEYNNLIYQFIGASYPKDFDSLASIADKVAGGFRTLSDPSKINVYAKHIKIMEVRHSMPLKSALTGWGANEESLDEHAVLNGMTLDQRIPPGTLIKFIDR